MRKILASFLALALFVVLLLSGIHGDEIIYSLTLFEHGLSAHKITHDGTERSFEIFIPNSYNGIKEHPIVFVLHGGGGNSDSAQKMSNFSELAEKEGFICVFPNGSGRLQDKLLTWNSGNCCSFAYENNIDDVGFIDSIIDFLRERLVIKENMIFACGLSNGGMMSFRLACELSEKIAAVGVVAGALNIDSEPILPVSVIQLHGTADNHVLYEGGIGSEQVGKGDRVDRPVSFAKDFWVNQNGCSETASTEIINEVTIDSYYGGRLGTEYKLYTIDGFGHAWPGGAKNRDRADGTDCSISATEEIWNFFKSHPKKGNPLEEVNNWAYQLQDLWDEKIDALADSQYDMIVVDRNGSIEGEDEDYNDRNDIERIRASKDDRLVICYIDVGEAESYRKYWQDDWEIGNPKWILTADPDGWDENYLVKFWEKEWVDIMLEQFDELVSAGYDGAYLDWLEIYDDPTVINAAKKDGVNPKEELIRFVRTLSSHARKQNPEFIIIAQNASAMGNYRNYRNLFDGIAQEAIWFDGSGDPDDSNVEADTTIDTELAKEYTKNLRVWQFYGFPVFNCEYAEKKASVAFDLGVKHGFKTYCARRPLEEISRTPPSFEQYFRCENLIHINELRPYYTFCPDSSVEKIPLVIVLHGGGGNANSKMKTTDFIDLSKKEGFAVVFANGQLRENNDGTDSRTWAAGDCFGEIFGFGTDIDYINRVIEKTSASLDIDCDRVFVCGHSMGGMMSHRLACELPDKITAIASVAGPLIHSECNPEKKIPILHIHGTADPVVPFTGGSRGNRVCDYPDVMEMISGVAKRNGHFDDPKTKKVSDNVTSLSWGERNKVELVTIDGFGHTWPKESDAGFSATDYIWCFFSDY